MENNVVLTMRGISKEFPGVKALQNVDFTLNKGEIHGWGKKLHMSVRESAKPASRIPITLIRSFLEPPSRKPIIFCISSFLFTVFP